MKTHQIEQLDIPQVLKDKGHLIDQGFVFPSFRETYKSIGDESGALVLTPGKTLLLKVWLRYHNLRLQCCAIEIVC